MTNNTPTAPGYHYRGEKIVRVTNEGGLYYWVAGSTIAAKVTDDGLWRGPVPMQGEWVSKDEHEMLLSRLEDIEHANAKRHLG